MFDKLTLMVFIAAAAQLQHCSSIAVKMAKIWKYEKKIFLTWKKVVMKQFFLNWLTSQGLLE